MKYKPWASTPANAWGSQDKSDYIFLDKWREYLQ